MLSPIELRPEPFQERLLEQIALSRELGHHRNLLVSATGTGKTVMAAVDYARLREALPRARLLFVAHREEILEQSLATFRHGLRDHAFGELWVGGRRPRQFEHVFASIQSLYATGFDDLDARHFDVVIIDEFPPSFTTASTTGSICATCRGAAGAATTSRASPTCLVLDFVGHHRREFRFDRRFGALLGGSRKERVGQIESGFPFLPAGCHLELDRKASELVLENMRQAVPSGWTAKVEELRRLGRQGDVSLARFLEETGLELDDVYAGARSWSQLRAEAGLPLRAAGPNEEALRRACGRLLHVDDFTRIETYRRLLVSEAPPDPGAMSLRDRRLLRMLVATVAERALDKATTLEQASAIVWAHPQVRAELVELMEVLATRVDHVHQALATHPHVPLVVHARYSRIEVLAAFGVGSGARVAPWQTGVYWAKEARADLLAFTLDKTSGQFSPTTRYRDHAISRQLIHWESQSSTRAESETGLRYRMHEARGTAVMLFARLRSDDRAFWFLGPASYVRHESELPMAITWRMRHALPGDLFASFAAAVA